MSEIVGGGGPRQSTIQDFIQNLRKEGDNQKRHSGKIIQFSTKKSGSSSTKEERASLQCAIEYARNLDW